MSIIDENVLVIGAGISGLKAASDLSEQGYDVKVLEASNHVGGRIYTHETIDGNKVELGGNWLHSDSRDHPIRQLLRKVDSQKSSLQGVSEERRSLYSFNGEEVFATAQIHRGGESSSIKTSREGLEALERISTLDGAPSDRFSLTHTYEDIDTSAEYIHRKSGEGRPLGEEGDDYFIRYGVDRILEPLKGSYGIETGSTITKVSEVSGKMSVEYTANGKTQTWTGDRVICTAPLGVLKRSSTEGGIEFSPALSTKKLEAIDELGMKNIRKLVFTFSKEAFKKANLSEKVHLFTDNGESKMFFNVNALSGHSSVENPTLIAWVPGDAAFSSDIAHKEGSKELKMQMLALLTKYYPSLNSESLVEYVDKAWGQDAHTFGAYSYVPESDGYKHMYEMINPEYSGKLIFAGEHTNPTHEATIHGAYLSGQRAAFQVTNG